MVSRDELGLALFLLLADITGSSRSPGAYRHTDGASAHDHFLSFHARVCLLVFDRDPNALPSLALDVLQELAEGQPTQLKGFLDGKDSDLLPPCGHPLLRRLWRGKEVDMVAERHPDLLDRFQPTRGRLGDHD